jgi:ribonucleoside-diphosphate reductase alpha chain
VYTRKKRMPDGTLKEFPVEDHAWRLYKAMGGDVASLPPYFVTALEISARAHEQMVAAVAPFVDTSISKTVNVPEDYPYEHFEDLYLAAWKSDLKGLATYRPNKVLGSVLSVEKAADKKEPQDFRNDDFNRRIRIRSVPEPVLASLRWPGRPSLSGGNPAWTYMIEHPHGAFAVFVGHVENGRKHAFEVWVNGAEQPRGLGALAKTLSMDMRANDPAWLRLKLDTLAKAGGDEPFDLAMPPHGEKKRMPSVVSAFAQVVRWRVEQLGAFHDGPSAVLDAMFSLKEPKTGHRRHDVLDGRRAQSAHRRRFRARPEGDRITRWRHAPVLDVAFGRIPEGARRAVQDPVARYARARSRPGRHEAEEAPRVSGAARRFHGVRARGRTSSRPIRRPSRTSRN